MTTRMFHSITLPVFLLCLVMTGCEREALLPEQADTTPPLAPAGLTVGEAQDGYVVLNWSRNSEKDLQAYVVHRADGTSIPFRAIDSTGNNYFVDEPLSYDTLYSYYLTAIDESGNESERSATVTTASPNKSAPAAPVDLAVNGRNIEGAPSIQLEWRPNSEADIAGYLIYRSTAPDVRADQSHFLARTPAAFYVDTAIAGTNRMYYYAILAFDAGGKRSDLTGIDQDQALDRPAQVAPAPNQQTTATPDFTWGRVPGAVLYKIVVSRTPAGDEVSSRLVGAGAGPTQTASYSGLPLEIGRVYYWRVGALSKQETAPNSLSASSVFHVVSGIVQ